MRYMIVGFQDNKDMFGIVDTFGDTFVTDQADYPLVFIGDLDQCFLECLVMNFKV